MCALTLLLIAFLRKIGRQPPSKGNMAYLATQTKDKDVVKAVLRELHTYHEGKLQSFEQIKRIHIMLEPFHESLITPTLKVKRQVARTYYKSILDDLYDQEPAKAKAEVANKRVSKL